MPEPVVGLREPQVECYHHISSYEYILARVLDKDLQHAARSASDDDTGNFYKGHKLTKGYRKNHKLEKVDVGFVLIQAGQSTWPIF